MFGGYKRRWGRRQLGHGFAVLAISTLVLGFKDNKQNLELQSLRTQRPYGDIVPALGVETEHGELSFMLENKREILPLRCFLLVNWLPAEGREGSSQNTSKPQR
jgi:hypothetical protein